MGSRYTREEVLKAGHVTESAVCEVEATLSRAVFSGQWLVYAWDDAPEAVRKLCVFNGGDEDWVAITKKEPEWLPSWVERLDTCHEPDVYLLDGVVVYVGSHA